MIYANILKVYIYHSRVCLYNVALDNDEIFFFYF